MHPERRILFTSSSVEPPDESHRQIRPYSCTSVPPWFALRPSFPDFHRFPVVFDAESDAFPQPFRRPGHFGGGGIDSDAGYSGVDASTTIVMRSDTIGGS
jgi:hypothetical protein